jgi:hypothetical protein
MKKMIIISDIRKCDSKVLKTFSYFFFVDALYTKQIISTLFRERRNHHWFCLVSLVSLKIKPFNQFSVLLWNYLIFENVVSDHNIQIKLNIMRNYLYYSVRDFFWLLSHGHLFHVSVFYLFLFWKWVWKKPIRIQMYLDNSSKNIPAVPLSSVK